MLTALAALLIGIHTLATGVGAVAATFAEIFYVKATADNRIDRRERDYFDTTYWALRYGMMTALVSGLVLLFVQYFTPDAPQTVFGATLWIQNTLILIIIAVAYFLSRKRMSWSIASAAIFAGWWMLFALDAWRAVGLSYLTLLITYLVLVGMSLLFWGYARALFHRHPYS